MDATYRRPGRAIRTRAASTIAAVMLIALVAPSAALAGGSGATIVRGIQGAAGSCEDGGFLMTGSLEGCWWIETFETKSDPAKSNLRATGTERFEGCMGDVCGEFYTTYTFTAKFDGPWPTSAELHGRCHHPIVGGTEGFAGVRGVLSFTDVVDVSPPYYPYWGNVRVDDGVGGTRSAGTSSGNGSGATTASSC
jgi:hypothetical protein